MSSSELSRLVGDVMSNPAMIQEAASIQDQQAMEQYIQAKGYDLTKDEMFEVWSMTAKVMAGHTQPLAMAQTRIEHAKTGL